jgi:MoaA/NifB/PqqE/SkfB family radical SAM enzyme
VNAAKRILRIIRDDPGYALRVAAAKLRTRFPIDYLFFRNGRAFSPVHLTLELTHRCNLACHMCDLYGRREEIDSIRSRREARGGELGVELLERLCASFGLVKPVLSFGGGEPLMNPRAAEMIRLAKARGFVCTLTTNGVLLSRHARELVESGLDSIVLSIDGPEEIHDSTRGVRGTFARAREGAMEIALLKRETGRVKPRLRVNCTINSRNFRILGSMPGVAESLGADSLLFSHLWFWDREIVERHNRACGDFCPVVEQNTHELDLLDPAVVADGLARAKGVKTAVAVKCLPELDDEEIRRYYTERAEPVTRSACRAVWLSAFVMPTGELLPCLDYAYGNLNERPFLELWNGARARSFRKRLRATGIFPGCVRCCLLYAF